MTDAAFCFNDTNRERSIIKRSASKKKGGSKSKKCSLPSDTMTRKEIAKMSGPVQTWKMTEFYSWEEFKQMPHDIQIEYLNFLIFKYGVGIESISTVVFNKSRTNLVKYIEKNSLKDKINRVGKKGESGKRSAAAFKAIVWAARNSPDEKIEETPEEEAKEEMHEEDILEDTMSSAFDTRFVPGLGYQKIDTTPGTKAMNFTTSYIANSIDKENLAVLETLFKGRKIHVTISISVV